MTFLVLAVDLLFLVTAFGIRTVVQWRRTGETGWRLGRPHSAAEGVARGLLVLGAVLLGVAAFADGDVEPTVTAVVGLALAAASIGLVTVAQLQMGSSWRIGVDPGERTELVTGGIYREVRNPIYTGMAAFALAQVLILPGWWAVAAAVAMVIGVELQARAVEEPYLVSTHGVAFAAWAATSGRFLPRVGRLSA